MAKWPRALHVLLPATTVTVVAAAAAAMEHPASLTPVLSPLLSQGGQILTNIHLRKECPS